MPWQEKQVSTRWRGSRVTSGACPGRGAPGGPARIGARRGGADGGGAGRDSRSGDGRPRRAGP